MGDVSMTKKQYRYFEERICKQCGKAFKARKDGHSIYCSCECQYESMRKTSVCKYCGKDFKGRHRTQQYCSDECRASARFNPSSHKYISHNKPTKLYSVFYGMKARCYNANLERYKDYGGRGIKICDEWLNDFECFYEWAMSNGYKEGLSIDRIDVNGNYEPSNCRWVSMKEQANNRRKKGVG